MDICRPDSIPLLLTSLMVGSSITTQVPLKSLQEARPLSLSGTTILSADSLGDHFITFSTDNESVEFHDLTDGAGHGILVATDNIYLSVQTSLTAYNGSSADEIIGFCFADLIYRFKEVKLQEYIGIVQSQQQ